MDVPERVEVLESLPLEDARMNASERSLLA
eukprot:SAG11_NODE_27946_length_327_cov_0.412281_2_plen_29_part_01